MVFEGFYALIKGIMFFASYVDSKNSFSHPLSPEKEKEYLIRSQNGDTQARDLLIEHNMRLVAHIAKKYANYPDADELLSVGSIGLIKAIKTYKDGKGTQLSTYAARCIENEMLMTLRANKKNKSNLSLYEPVGTDKEGNEITLMDLMSVDDDLMVDCVENKILKEKLMSLIEKVLDKREFEIIKMRYGLDDGVVMPQREVARHFNISRSYISRIEKKSIEKLREYIKTNKMDF
jgi:RNA polymerase sporulation-specific sigma factor